MSFFFLHRKFFKTFGFELDLRFEQKISKRHKVKFFIKIKEIKKCLKSIILKKLFLVHTLLAYSNFCTNQIIGIISGWDSYFGDLKKKEILNFF